MVYHKDADHSLHMAVSDDSYNWRAVNGDKPVVKGEDIAVQKGIREPHNFGFVETKDFKEWKPIGYFNDRGAPMKREGFSEQKHGAIVKAPSDLVQAMERNFADRLTKEAEAL